MSSILIVGGTGNISFDVALHLRSRGNTVVCLTRGSSLQLESFLESKGILIKRYSENFSSLSFDYVIDFVSYSPNDVKKKVHIINTALKAYVFISTTAFYDRVGFKPPFKEAQSGVDLNWNYAANKLFTENCLSDMFKSRSPKLFILRLGHTIGMSLPVYLGNPNQCFIDHIQLGRPVPFLFDISLPWSVGSSTGVSYFLNSYIDNLYSMPDRLCVHYSGQITTWETLISQSSISLNRRPISSKCNISDVINFTSNWLPSILYHKRYCDYYDTSLLNDYLGSYPEPSIFNLILKAAGSKPKAMSHNHYHLQLGLLERLSCHNTRQLLT